MKNWIKEIVWAGAAVLVSFILQKNFLDFWCWWLAVEILGLIALPFCAVLFKNFEDRGWMFSKILGIAATGFLTWMLVSVKLFKFTTVNCLLVCAGCLAASIVMWKFCPDSQKALKIENKKLIFLEEILFILVFLMWTYFAGFHAQAYGTEKFMDYGFMESMMRSTVMPPRDLWYSEGHINYYYGGQYFAVFLTKLSGREVEVTYNLMRSFIAAVAFILPFSLVYQMTVDSLKKKQKGDTPLPFLSGCTAGAAVSIAGNMHYVVYCLAVAVKELIAGVPQAERTGYWFPDATRYIGFHPDVPDKTIHEFPCYSFVLGDLHAHVVNILFVLLVLGLLYAFTSQKRMSGPEQRIGKTFYQKQLLNPHILLVSILLGMFQWTNFWDFVIYYVVLGGTVLFTNIIQFEGKIKRILGVTLLQAIEVLLVSYFVIIPFTIQFASMVDGIALAQYHSLWYQLLILWGLPGILTVLFISVLLYDKLVRNKQKNLYTLMASVEIPDLFAVITGLCAIGLVMIPELVYVRDIYENGNARANTMFKLTYQAYIMFGITMGYVIYRLLLVAKSWIVKVIAIFGLFCFVLTCGYFGKSVESWYGNIWDNNQYEGLDATAYISYTFVEDSKGIQWLKENVKDVKVVLEANGDSYSDYDRVSAMTGLPTVLGWYVHEWLWRNDTDDLNRKSADIEEIFTSSDTERVNRLLKNYDVSYIFVGAKEREKYGERLNQETLKSLGTVVFQDDTYETYIIEVR